MNNYQFTVVENKRKRVIIDTDAKNEADDQYAILHALMTPMFNLRGIIATHFGHDRMADSMQASYQEVLRVLHHSGFEGRVKAVRGAATAMQKREGFFGATAAQDSDGAQLIIEEALSLPVGERLYIAALGPLTNVASALLLEPRIEHQLVIIWNGGGLYPQGGQEFNLVNDIAAANCVMQSQAELWQIPTKVYGAPRVSLAELQYKVQPCGEIGDYLFHQTLSFLDEMKEYAEWPRPESLDICDLTVMGLLMEEHRYCYEYINAPAITADMFYQVNRENRPIRVYTEIDARYILEDFFCKLAINYRR